VGKRGIVGWGGGWRSPGGAQAEVVAGAAALGARAGEVDVVADVLHDAARLRFKILRKYAIQCEILRVA